jgi:hypothetical protein
LCSSRHDSPHVDRNKTEYTSFYNKFSYCHIVYLKYFILSEV